VRAVTLEQWRERFVLRYGSEGDGKRKADTVRKAFRRAHEKRLEAETVGVSDT
jgi:hypothetical protein